MTLHAPETITRVVTEKYGAVARQVRGLPVADVSCTGPSCCSGPAAAHDPITSNLYARGETDVLPERAVLASLGCGNPTALAELAAGEVVLDLGSGGGIDVLLSARRVGPTGRAIGVDMTDDMLALARENAAEAGVTNVEFLKGHIEALPLPDASVDVIISNCVVNLSADKPRVLAEAFRVLKPGGRLAISDVVMKAGAPAAVRENLALWAGCVAGAMPEDELRAALDAQGFTGVDLEPTRVYDASDAREMIAGLDLPNADRLVAEMDGQVFSAFIRATKPTEATA